MLGRTRRQRLQRLTQLTNFERGGQQDAVLTELRILDQITLLAVGKKESGHRFGCFARAELVESFKRFVAEKLGTEYQTVGRHFLVVLKAFDGSLPVAIDQDAV